MKEEQTYHSYLRDVIFQHLYKPDICQLYSESQMRTALAMVGAEFVEKAFVMIQFLNVSERNSVYSPVEFLFDSENFAKTHSCLVSEVENTFGSRFTAYAFCDGNSVMCILNVSAPDIEPIQMFPDISKVDHSKFQKFEQETNHLMEDIRKMSGECLHRLSLINGITFIALVSRSQIGMERIRVCYNDLVNINEFRNFFHLKSNVILFADFHYRRLGRSSIQPNLTLEKKILNSIYLNDTVKLEKNLHDYFFENLSFKNTPIQMFKIRFYSMLDYVLNMICVNKLLDDETFYDLLLYFYENLEHLTADNLEHMILTLTQTILSYSNKNRPNKMPTWVDKINDYINEHYADFNLNISTLASAFGMSRDYVSRIYKKSMGVSLMDKLHLTRLEHAQRLLSVNYSVPQVARMVGYNSITTFSRCFIRYFGCTPNEYKNGSIYNECEE